MRKKCRVWWPKNLASTKEPPPSISLLFGWIVSSSSASVDFVVAFACNEDSLSSCQSNIHEILCDSNGNMPVCLQDKASFSLLGQCATYVNINDKVRVGSVDVDKRKSSSVASVTNMVIGVNYGERSCGCNLQQRWHTSVQCSHWIQLVYSKASVGSNIHWVPQLHHIHWKEEIIFQCDVHVIFYETPVYGVHHFSLNFWRSSDQVKTSMKNPKWVEELHDSQPLFDWDVVLLAINTACAAKIVFERQVCSKTSHTSCFFMSYVFVQRLLAIFMASISTLVYIILQVFHTFLSFRSSKWIRIPSAMVFCNSWTNIQIRCCQILYWPVFLQNNGFRLETCVEYAQKAALHRHSMWSSLVVDLLLGNLIGLALLFHAESACSIVLTFANTITNELLRSGCVWLMGVPAGFKLNTELAGVLGMVSLNAIQIWSTLWIFAGFLSIYFIKGLALLGIIFGATTSAAFIMDMISLAMLHVSALHWAVSLLYSMQIQALAALWRLFRGRKWNPLRQRLDSYDYSVKQHIVGSLMFTPLLLLLPTTSVFYIFFTILNTAITLVCVLIEVSLSMIHGTPYIKLFLWLVKRRLFPSGIWFEILSCQNDSPEFACHDEISSSSSIPFQKDDKRSSILVSVLHSNNLHIGEVILPHYKKVFSGVSSFLVMSAYGALTGNRTPSTLGTRLPSVFPWFNIPAREYWFLCYNSIVGCTSS